MMLWMFIFRLNGSVTAGRVGVTISKSIVWPGSRQSSDCQMRTKDRGSPPIEILQICLHDDRLRIALLTFQGASRAIA
jgi:hypothetical protein